MPWRAGRAMTRRPSRDASHRPGCAAPELPAGVERPSDPAGAPREWRRPGVHPGLSGREIASCPFPVRCRPPTFQTPSSPTLPPAHRTAIVIACPEGIGIFPDSGGGLRPSGTWSPPLHRWRREQFPGCTGYPRRHPVLSPAVAGGPGHPPVRSPAVVRGPGLPVHTQTVAGGPGWRHCLCCTYAQLGQLPVHTLAFARGPGLPVLSLAFARGPGALICSLLTQGDNRYWVRPGLSLHNSCAVKRASAHSYHHLQWGTCPLCPPPLSGDIFPFDL